MFPVCKWIIWNSLRLLSTSVTPMEWTFQDLGVPSNWVFSWSMDQIQILQLLSNGICPFTVGLSLFLNLLSTQYSILNFTFFVHCFKRFVFQSTASLVAAAERQLVWLRVILDRGARWWTAGFYTEWARIMSQELTAAIRRGWGRWFGVTVPQCQEVPRTSTTC